MIKICAFDCSEVPAAQPKGAWIRSGEPTNHAGGRRALDPSGAEQLPVRVSPGPPPLLHLRRRRLVDGHSQLRLRRGGRQVCELRLEMIDCRLLSQILVDAAADFGLRVEEL
jgi:hypothetical protein